MTPAATYRLQLRAGMTLADAAELVPRLDRLGISDLYLSPVAVAAPGSTHGYDVVDPNEVDPAIGGEPGLAALAQVLAAHGMGLILDIVPNHMAAAYENAWWRDVLLNGEGSPYAAFFDIDWRPPRADLAGRILLPVLGERYAEAAIRRDGDVVLCGDQRFPVRGPAGGDLHELLTRQVYRLAYWRSGAREVNYRRFFDVNGLVGVRAEDPAVFAATHAGLRSWVEAGFVTGVRVDHIDGLADPAAYLRRLAEIVPAIWVEKVLAPGEELPPDWPCLGTTGYEFAAAVDALLYDGGGAATLDLLHERWGARPAPYREVLRQGKREALRDLLAADVDRLARDLAALAPADREGADLSTDEIRDDLVEITVRLPVYRTYGAGSLGSGFVARALAADGAVATRWRQLSGPAMAKGGEDTALYRHVRLTSLNEVGSDPDTPGMTVADFHAFCAGRRPGSLNATSTHDSKRSEDVRARIHVLAEIAGLWSQRCARWRLALGEDCAGLEPALALLLLQAAVGAWPDDPAEVPVFADRLADYGVKAAREARGATSWLRPDPGYEARVRRFARALTTNAAFLDDFLPLQRLVAHYGAVNSLAQVVLKVACPGIPDIYQGCEAWRFSLADPDNRRPVDFAREDEKLRVTASALRFRRANRRLFAEGEYIPVPAAGAYARHVCAFARRLGDAWALAVVPRFTARLTGADRTERAQAPLGEVWADTRLELPPDAPGAWRSVLTGAPAGAMALADLLAELPVALLEAPARV
jgi:(1->4)-alpha-D-glucan 1-alpha-D-glucosylmutase